MEAQRIVALAWAMSLAGCSDSTELTELTVNVIVTEDRVEVAAREVERPCTCNTGEFPEVGSCVVAEDVDECTCDPRPAACLNPPELWRGGVMEADLVSEGVGHDPTAELVLSGCGATARVSLSTGSFPIPTIGDATFDGQINVAYSATGNPASVAIKASASDPFGYNLCREAPSGQISVNVPGAALGDDGVAYYLHALSERTDDTNLGTVHVFAGGTDDGWIGLP